ncbi:MAG TPA: hypothetical protein VFZ17_02640 [Acidimicrobiia bacterium]|nr:hypothetical protein [Acidimicrobiia bacterium]
MGMFDKIKGAKDQAADAMANAAAMQQAAGAAAPAGMDMSSMPGMGGQDMAKMAAYSQKVNKIGQVGVEAPGVIHAIRAVGEPDISGATWHEFDVSIRPAGGDPYQTTIEQSMLPFQMEGLSEGQAIVAKYDPDVPAEAIIQSW